MYKDNGLIETLLQTGYVSYGDIWNLSTRDYETIIRAYKKKKEQEQKEKDFFNWQLGLYFRVAIASCFTGEVKYPNEPFFSKKNSEENMDEKTIELERERAFLYFSNLNKHINIKK